MAWSSCASARRRNRVDADDIIEAVQSAATAGMRYDGPRNVRNHISHADRAVRSFRRQLKLFLADLPGEATVEDLRELLDGSRDHPHDETEGDDE